MIKIISKKEYEHLTEELDKSQKTILDMDSQIRELTNKIEEKKGSPSVNQRKPFCVACKYSYLDTTHSIGDYKVYGCRLTVTCDSFCR